METTMLSLLPRTTATQFWNVWLGPLRAAMNIIAGHSCTLAGALGVVQIYYVGIIGLALGSDSEPKYRTLYANEVGGLGGG